jgi:hypothetical protein
MYHLFHEQYIKGCARRAWEHALIRGRKDQLAVQVPRGAE